MSLTNEKLNQLFQELGVFRGRKIEMDIKQNPIFDSMNTYNNFQIDVVSDYNDETVLILQDFDMNTDESIQDCRIKANTIKDYNISGKSNLEMTVFNIKAINDMTIGLCLSDKLPKCDLCGKVFDDVLDTKWSLYGCGNYGSLYDGDKIDMKICDDCFHGIMSGGKNHEQQLSN